MPPEDVNSEHERLRELGRVLMAFTSVDDCCDFLEDLCTPAELQAMVGRWQVVVMLQEKCSYRRISELSGISTATVTRVARFLSGGRGGYRKALALWQAAKERKL